MKEAYLQNVVCGMESSEKGATVHDVVIIGGGASGTALLYTLATYTTIKNIALIEKEHSLGRGNSHAKNNSQTLHVGDIETNYSIEKARQVKPASMMVVRYVRSLKEVEQENILKSVQKMVLGVGEYESNILRERFDLIKGTFPNLQKLERSDIALVEPAITDGRDPDETLFALFDPVGYAVNFGELAKSFVKESRKSPSKNIHILLDRQIITIEKEGGLYHMRTNKGSVFAKVVVVDTDAYSLLFAKSLGYGKEYSLIPIAGTFYFSEKLLRGKVYTVQKPRLPFAAVHGDPDLLVPHKTRWGPTARFFPVLESGNLKSTIDYFRSSGLHHLKTWSSFISILLEPARFKYLLQNILYEIPFAGKYFFVSEVKKIVPTVQARDLKRAKGFGGMRLQRVDINKKELLLGEGKIIGDNIIFNMAPSPGASVCLFNAFRDAECIERFLHTTEFDKERMRKDLMEEEQEMTDTDTSMPSSYPA